MFISLLFGATYGAEYLKKLLFTPSKEAKLKIIPISLLDKDKIQINKEIKVEKKDMIAATPVVTVESGNVSGMLNSVEMNAVPGFEKEVIAVNSVEVNGGDLVDEDWEVVAATPVVTVESGNVSGMLNSVEMNAVPGFEKEVIAVNSVEVNGGDLVDEDWEVVAATPVVTVESGNVSGMLNSVEINEMITTALLGWEIIEEKPAFSQLM